MASHLLTASQRAFTGGKRYGILEMSCTLLSPNGKDRQYLLSLLDSSDSGRQQFFLGPPRSRSFSSPAGSSPTMNPSLGCRNASATSHDTKFRSWLSNKFGALTEASGPELPGGFSPISAILGISGQVRAKICRLV